MSFPTAFTQAFDVPLKFPLVSAPMSGIAGGGLAAAVCLGGGLGLIGHCEGAQLTQEILTARVALRLENSQPLPIGIGILAFATNHMDEPTETSFLMQIIAARPAAIWLAFEGVRGTHKRLVSEIRRLEKNMHGERAKIMIMVGTVELAKEVATYDIDVIVAQGTEAGGHANDTSTGLPLGTLLPLIHSHLLTLSNPPLLLAAGGLSTGQDLVSILPYASGMVCGTAFTCCPESKYGDIQKSRLLAAKSGDDTVKTASFDRIRGHEFGDHIDGRALRNSTTREEEEGVSVEKLRQRYLNCANEAELLDRSAIWCGTGVGLVNEVVGAQDVVSRIGNEALQARDQPVV